MTTILVLGATGPMGRCVLAELAGKGLSVRSLARRPEALADEPNAGEVVKGDVLDPDSLKSALQGVDVVISALGSRPTTGPQYLLSQGTANLFDAAAESGVSRVIVVTGLGAGDSKGHGGFFYDRILNPLLLRKVYEDKDRQEDVVRGSALAWTIVRPGILTNGRRTGVYRVIGELQDGVRIGRISRADVADYLVSAALEDRDLRATVHLTY